MAKIFLSLLVVSLLVDKWFTYGASVFVSQQSASGVLKRQRRYNSGHLEEVVQRDNLERECIEEKCSWEEAREVFEDNAKTMEFWTGYIDGDQCESSPCQNGGRCEDGMSSYMCWCLPGYGGKNCEIEIAAQCDVDNGGCMQFCSEDKVRGATCACAHGYQRGADKMTCEPLIPYSCGRLGKGIKEKLGQRSVIEADTLEELEMAFPHNISSENNTLSLTNGTAGPVSPEVNSTQPPTVDSKTPWYSWHFYPTLPTITAESSIDERIVGGNEAKPGEIPWQVAIISKATNIVFCGGSLLSEVWVISAAHCFPKTKGIEIKKTILVRLGEHHTQRDDKTESDHEVDEIIRHPRYDAQKSQYNHDIALLRLKTPVTFSDYIIPICLGPKDFTEFLMKNTATSLVSGWGRMRFGGRESPTLQKVEVPYVDRTDCKGSSSDHVSRFMFCAGYSTEQKDACQGDSGGPHASRYKNTWFLTGIVSWGEECAKDGKYGIYTRISRYFHWISNVTGLTLASTN